MSGLKLKPQTPEVFAPLWTVQSRYKGAHGGRGSAKSNDRAQAVIIAMATRPGCRVVCVREVQYSIKDSVKQLLADWIDRLGVGSLFDILETEIRGPNKSLCIFRGMNDQNNDTIAIRNFCTSVVKDARVEGMMLHIADGIYVLRKK